MLLQSKIRKISKVLIILSVSLSPFTNYSLKPIKFYLLGLLMLYTDWAATEHIYKIKGRKTD
jgi:hypothetical protein